VFNVEHEPLERFAAARESLEREGVRVDVDERQARVVRGGPDADGLLPRAARRTIRDVSSPPVSRA